MFYKIDYSNFLYENNTSVVIHIESFFAVTKFAFLNQQKLLFSIVLKFSLAAYSFFWFYSVLSTTNWQVISRFVS